MQQDRQLSSHGHHRSLLGIFSSSRRKFQSPSPQIAVFHANHRDEQLKSKLRREAPGILNWMLRGLQRYVDAGYKMTYPEIVEKATSEYRISQDIVGQFINTKCELAGKIQVSDLYSSFKFWAEQSRERHNLTLRKFGDEVVKREGIFRNKEKDATYFHGVSLRLSAADQQLNELAEEI
jgi:putative DNA primase/helicase